MSSDAYQIRAEKVLIADNHDASSGARASKRVVPSSAMAPSGKAMLSSADMVDGQQALVGGGCRGRRQVMAEVQVGAWVWWSGAALHSAFCRWRQRGSCAVDRWAATGAKSTGLAALRLPVHPWAHRHGQTWRAECRGRRLRRAARASTTVDGHGRPAPPRHCRRSVQSWCSA